MGFFDLLNSVGVDDNEDDLEERMEEAGLEEWEKEEVRNGNQDIFNFEEEELEDDDYYSEDDE
ncbi:MAG: hypothetical protein J6X02_03260 [Bacilli bacterium]|nr:hypothetical protein [Bacilli bacterium]